MKQFRVSWVVGHLTLRGGGCLPPLYGFVHLVVIIVIEWDSKYLKALI